MLLTRAINPLEEGCLLREHRGLVSLVFRLLCGCQGRQEGGLPQLGFVCPRKNRFSLGSP